MFQHNFFTYSGKIIFRIIGDIFYFPIWWYSVGFIRLLKGVWRFLLGQEQSLGFFIWLKNIFVPMYGQRDWAGRLISFFIRLVQIIFRGLALLIWIAVLLIFIAVWLLGPILLVLALVWQIFQ
ncbi:MAG: hypothetical protein ACYC40_01595 [Patescibacteria group bacterium]